MRLGSDGRSNKERQKCGIWMPERGEFCEELSFCYRRCQKHYFELSRDVTLFKKLRAASREKRALMLDELDRTQKVRPEFHWEFENPEGESELAARCEEMGA